MKNTRLTVSGRRITLSCDLLEWLVGFSYWKVNEWWCLSFNIGPFALRFHNAVSFDAEPLMKAHLNTCK